MLLDANGKRPSEYIEMYPSAHCPGCKRKLYKRGGGHKKCIEHWAHYPDQTNDKCDIDVSNCEKESEWHMQLKLRFRDLGYQIEKVIDVDGKKYRIDVVLGRYFVELINTMSSSYEQKAVDLLRGRHLAAWLFNGNVFSEFTKTGYRFSGSSLRFIKRIDSLFQSAYVLYDRRIYPVSRNGIVLEDAGIVDAASFDMYLNGKFTPHTSIYEVAV